MCTARGPTPPRRASPLLPLRPPPPPSLAAMRSRLLLALLATGVAAFACGPRSHSSETTSSVPPSMVRQENSPLATSLNVTVDDGVRLAFNVMNASAKTIELRFPSGQTHEFIVLDESGREVWRWSAGHMFTQALQTKMLDAGETMAYDDRWRPEGLRGSFTAVATLNSSSHPVETRVLFTIP